MTVKDKSIEPSNNKLGFESDVVKIICAIAGSFAMFAFFSLMIPSEQDCQGKAQAICLDIVHSLKSIAGYVWPVMFVLLLSGFYLTEYFVNKHPVPEPAKRTPI